MSRRARRFTVANNDAQLSGGRPLLQRELKTRSFASEAFSFRSMSIQQDHLNQNNPGKAERSELFQNMATLVAAAN
jgi:hypothetical protein